MKIMASGLEELLGMLYNIIQDAFSLPFGSDRCIVDRDKVLGILDEINAILPGDLKQARSIVDARNDILGSAKKEAEAIKRKAEEQSRHLVNEDEVLRSARKKAGDMLVVTEDKAREVRRAANEYVDSTLRKTEESLTALLAEFRKTRADYRVAAGRVKENKGNDDI